MFDSLPINLSKTKRIYLGLFLRDFLFLVNVFFFNCFLLLFIVHEFYFSKEPVHDGGIQRSVGCD